MRISTLVSSFFSLTYLLVDAASNNKSANEFDAGTFVRIEGLQSSTNLNGSYAMVLEPTAEVASGRSGVMVIMDEKILSFDPESKKEFRVTDYLVKKSIKNENLHRFEWNSPDELSLNEVISNTINGLSLSGYRAVEMNSQDRLILDRIVQLLWKICAGNPELFVPKNTVVRNQARAIGAWILQRYHFSAMKYVANKNRQMRPNLNSAWNHIGVWES